MTIMTRLCRLFVSYVRRYDTRHLVLVGDRPGNFLAVAGGNTGDYGTSHAAKGEKTWQSK
ncbi:MAG TPA: hypothetical protein VNG51_16895 [Ktedonobacteraceae bacterium]|nr:hypothetical protein [Ktedonobacteraceae bacterium]